jgi:hypothetical protein
MNAFPKEKPQQIHGWTTGTTFSVHPKPTNCGWVSQVYPIKSVGEGITGNPSIIR